MAAPIQLPNDEVPEQFDEWVSLGCEQPKSFTIITRHRTEMGIELGYDHGRWPRQFALELAQKEADRLGIPLFVLGSARA